MEIKHALTSGKTIKILEELEKSIADNPSQIVFTNSKEFKKYIEHKYPEANVKLCEGRNDNHQ